MLLATSKRREIHLLYLNHNDLFCFIVVCRLDVASNVSTINTKKEDIKT